MADMKKVAIGTRDAKLEFEVPQPYAEGHALTAVEAKQLNQVYAENICNNFRARVQATIKGDEGAMSEKDLRSSFAEYASNYIFTEASVGTGRSTMTPLEREARRVAKAVVVQLLAKDGRKQKDVDKDKFEAEVARFAESDKVQKIAAKNLKDAEALAAAALEAAN